MKYMLLVIMIAVILAIPLFAAASVIPLAAYPQSPRFVARIVSPTAENFTQFTRAGFDICSYHPGEHLDILLDDSLFQELKADYPSLHITQTEAQLKANLLSNERDIPGYRNYQTMLDELMQLQAQYPNLMQVTSIGNTWGAQYAAQQISTYQDFDHQIWAVKLSNNVQMNEDEPAFYFVGEHHAREPISMETVMGILNHLLEGYGVDTSITDYLNTSEIWLVPLLNPDGHKIVIDQTDVWWRKNLRDNNGNHAINLDDYGNGADGVDLNRNYGYKWGFQSATDDPFSVTYHGTEAFSELETQVFRDLLLSRNFIAGISYHTYGQYVLYPFGYQQNIISPDAVEMHALAGAMAATIPTQSGGSHYSSMPSYSLYPVSGSSDDWAYGEKGIFAYTIEMAEEFIPPAAEVPEIVQNNLTAAKLLLARKNSKLLKGHITDALTGEPLQAMIFVEGIDNNPLKTNQTYSEPVYGSYYRFLPEGTYQVQYICPGYSAESFSQSIVSTGVTIQDVALLPAEPFSLQVHISDPTGSAIAGATLAFLDTEQFTYHSNEQGLININNFLPGTYRISITCPGYEQLLRMESFSGTSRTFILNSNPQVADGFELGLTAWQISGNWERSTSQHYSGSYSLTDSPTGNYSNNQTSNCRLLQPVNLQGVLNVNLQFYAKHNISLDGDYCMLQYSTNGVTWKYLDDFTGVSAWQLYSYNLNHLIGSNAYLRFTMYSNSSGSADGIYIDDVKVFVTSHPTNLTEELLPTPSLSINSYPNPFSDKLNLEIDCPENSKSPIAIAVYNLKGQLVRELFSEVLAQGKHQLVWDGKDASAQACANGMYFIKLSRTNEQIKSIKTILLK